MEWHSFAERFPLLDGEEWAAFKESIRQTGGNTAPILYRVIDGKAQGLDGRNRELACNELGIECRAELVDVADQDVKTFILIHNVYRRHLTREMRKELVAELRADGKSTRAIAETLGTTHTTVQRDLDEIDHDEDTPGGTNVPPDVKNTANVADSAPKQPAKVTGKDGKEYPAKVTTPPKEAPPADDESDAPWVDGWGIPITKEAEAAFRDADKFDDLVKVLRQAKRLYAELAEMPGGKLLTFPGISLNAKDSWRHAGIETAIRNVQDCQPKHTVCPYAYSPVKGHKHTNECPLCRGLNWLGAVGPDRIPEDLIKAAKKANGVG